MKAPRVTRTVARPAKRSAEPHRDERAAVREELAARRTQPRDDVSVPEHGEHDPARREPFHHVAGISDRELQQARARRPGGRAAARPRGGARPSLERAPPPARRSAAGLRRSRRVRAPGRQDERERPVARRRAARRRRRQRHACSLRPDAQPGGAGRDPAGSAGGPAEARAPAQVERIRGERDVDDLDAARSRHVHLGPGRAVEDDAARGGGERRSWRRRCGRREGECDRSCRRRHEQNGSRHRAITVKVTVAV